MAPQPNTALFYATSGDAKKNNWTQCRDFGDLESKLKSNSDLVWSIGVDARGYPHHDLDGTKEESLEKNVRYINEFNNQLVLHAAIHDVSGIIEQLRYRNGSEVSFSSIPDTTPLAAGLFYAEDNKVELANRNKTWKQCKNLQELKQKLSENPNRIWSVGVGESITGTLDGQNPSSLAGNEKYLESFNREINKLFGDIEGIFGRVRYRNGATVNKENLAKSMSIVYKMTKDFSGNQNIKNLVGKIVSISKSGSKAGTYFDRHDKYQLKEAIDRYLAHDTSQPKYSDRDQPPSYDESEAEWNAKRVQSRKQELLNQSSQSPSNCTGVSSKIAEAGINSHEVAGVINKFADLFTSVPDTYSTSTPSPTPNSPLTNPQHWYADEEIQGILRATLEKRKDVYIAPVVQIPHSDSQNQISGISQSILNNSITELFNAKTVVIPVAVMTNEGDAAGHWTALSLKNENGIEAAYQDPRGNAIPKALNDFIKDNGANVTDLQRKQRYNGSDCGPFTVDNLIKMATGKVNDIIATGGENGAKSKAASLRQAHAKLLNPGMAQQQSTRTGFIR